MILPYEKMNQICRYQFFETSDSHLNRIPNDHIDNSVTSSTTILFISLCMIFYIRSNFPQGFYTYF